MKKEIEVSKIRELLQSKADYIKDNLDIAYANNNAIDTAYFTGQLNAYNEAINLILIGMFNVEEKLDR